MPTGKSSHTRGRVARLAISQCEICKIIKMRIDTLVKPQDFTQHLTAHVIKNASHSLRISYPFLRHAQGAKANNMRLYC